MTRTIPRGLPDPVATRLREGDLSAVAARQRGRPVESRLAKVELRTDGDDVIRTHGYATVYDYPYPILGGPPYGWTETIAAGAARKSIAERDDVRLLLNHDGLPLARTRSGTLRLTSDDVGLLHDAELDARSRLVQDIVSAMERGDLDEMSFAFEAIRQEWNADYTERRITEVKLWDVSLVTYPANGAASAYLRDRQPPVESEKRSGMSLALARAQRDALSVR